MLRLRPFKDSDAKEIATWTSEEEEFLKWSAGTFGEFPLDEKRLLEDIYKKEHYEKYYPFVAFDESGLVGFLILRIPGEDNKVLRLAYIIINSSKRNQGYGKELVKLALSYTFDIYGADFANLGVFANNVNAYKCYESIGFQENGKSTEYKIHGETWKTIEMEIDRNNKTWRE
ncbi:MAG: GNAT family protein [Eubacteriales bacterium]|nr:GNAT family protein [Eubacteriales bacterium]